MKTEKEQVTIRLPAELKKELDIIAKKKDVDVSSLARNILKDFTRKYDTNECCLFFFE